MPNPTDQKAAASFPWNPDLGDGRFKNPVLYADYSDPDAIRVGDDYWLTASSFNCTPGLPILHSTDLVNWTIVNHALKNLPDKSYEAYRGGCGVWAPAIRFHDGKYWIFYPTPDEGIYVVTATDPRGEWSAPTPVIEGKGLIDPCPFWDDDGKAYLVHAYANSRAGIKHKIRVGPMAPDGSKVLGDGEIVFDDPVNHPTMEGPKMHKRNGYYYISAPAGGVATGWQVILRSKNVYGPYEPKVVLAQGKTPINGPHQGAIIDTPTGEWWFLHFQELQPYGRIVHLQPVTWKNDWPLMGVNQDEKDCGEPVLTYEKPKSSKPTVPAIPATSDEFDGEKLGLQWQWNANHKDNWAKLTKNPGLRLFAQPSGDLKVLELPHLLAQKFPAPVFTVDTRIEIPEAAAGVTAGLAIVGKAKHVAITLDRDHNIRIITDGTQTQHAAVKSAAVQFRAVVEAGGICAFFYREDNQQQFTPLGESFQSVEGHWIGARVGLYCNGSDGESFYSDVDYFRFS